MTSTRSEEQQGHLPQSALWTRSHDHARTARTGIDMDEAPVGLLTTAAPALSPLIEGRNRASVNRLVAYLIEHPSRHGR